MYSCKLPLYRNVSMHRAWFDGPFPQLAWIAHAANTWVLALRTWVVRSQLCLRVFVRSTEVYCEAVKSRFLDSLHEIHYEYIIFSSTEYRRLQPINSLLRRFVRSTVPYGNVGDERWSTGYDCPNCLLATVLYRTAYSGALGMDPYYFGIFVFWLVLMRDGSILFWNIYN